VTDVPAGFGMSFVHVERRAIKVSAIEGGDGFLALDVVCHLDKTGSSSLSGIAVGPMAFSMHNLERWELG